jgi:hypothetical protein
MPYTQEGMANTFKSKSRRRHSPSERYLTILAIFLLGYAVMGKGFAYLGLPPLYVGEIAFLTGIVVFLRNGALVASLATLPSLLLATLMVWVIVRTVPFLSVYGFDALRDSTIVMYGGFAFVVIGLLLEDARRIDTVLRYYSILLVSLPAMSVGFLFTRYWSEYIPVLFGRPIVDITASAAGTHLAGTMVFALIGYRKVSRMWVLVWFFTLALAASTNRGAMLAALVPAMFAMLMLGRSRQLLTVVLAAVTIFAVLLAVETGITQDNEAERSLERQFSAHQILENATSIVGHSGQRNEGTKAWRLNWWNVIINDTFHGPLFWTGKGFGINLADDDGFDGPRSPSPLRSPHSAHMTMLSRAGVPGLVLWAIVLISWAGMQLNAMLCARARGHDRWANLFLFVFCYAVSILINASVDVTLEGPMQGIWFWCLFGFGIGSVMIYRAQDPNGIAAEARR